MEGENKMASVKFSSIIKSVKIVMAKHSPEILTGVGIAGMITTTVLAVRATPKAIKIIDDETKKRTEEHKNESDENKTSKVIGKIEMLKLTWRCYIPSALTGTMSIICLVGSNSVNLRRNAALAAAYTLSESTLKEYQEKVIETIGEKKEKAVRDEIAKDKISNAPINNREVIITGKGNTLCYDGISGRYFYSDIEKLRKAENELNRELRDEMYISLNEFYYKIGLNPIGIGDDIGWHIDTGYMELDFSSQLSDNETPCLVLDYKVAPRYDFNMH